MIVIMVAIVTYRTNSKCSAPPSECGLLDYMSLVALSLQVVALFALVAAVAALPAPAAPRPPGPKDDLKGSEAVYLASPYVASYPAAVPAVSTYSAAVPAYSTYSAYSAVPAVGYGYAAAPYAYYYR